MKVIIDGVKYVPQPEQQKGKSLLNALDVQFEFCGDEIRVRDYLCRLLEALWHEQDGFSGKRPFGNSGWEYDLYKPLIAAGFITGGSLDKEGYVKEIGDGWQYVNHLILAMCHGVAK